MAHPHHNPVVAEESDASALQWKIFCNKAPETMGLGLQTLELLGRKYRWLYCARTTAKISNGTI